MKAELKIGFLNLFLGSFLWTLVSLDLVQGFYLPGVAPTDYYRGNKVPLDVNSLTSKDTLIPYDYYNPRFKFCKPQSIISKHETLGSILFGDRLKNSPFEIDGLKDESCKILCKVELEKNNIEFIQHAIKNKYHLMWYIDGLPVATLMKDLKANKQFYLAGFSLGHEEDNKQFLFNHFHFTIQYHPVSYSDAFRIVGVLMEPSSLKDNSDCNIKKGNHERLQVVHKKSILPISSTLPVTYTYSITWKESSISWGTRWDNYLYNLDPKIHWFSICNSLGIVLMLSGIVAIILLNTLQKDISRYNSFVDLEGGFDEDFGWKTVHADVFRAPQGLTLLSVAIGSGSQILAMLAVTIVIALLGVLSPSSRGSLTTLGLLCYLSFSMIAGFVSIMNYRSFGGEEVKRTIFLTAVLIPMWIFGILVTLNFILVITQSSAAVPFGTLLILALMWIIISIPGCFFGAFYNLKFDPIIFPIKTNQIPRQIPTQPLYLNKYISSLAAGLLPFGAIFIEMFFIIDSVWTNTTYYVFGFLSIVFIITIITCSEVSVIMCYFHLCNEDYRWQWRSFMASATCGLYVFIYEMIFLVYKMQVVNSAGVFLYIGWSLVISAIVSIATGTIGYIATLLFVKKIFSSIKVD